MSAPSPWEKASTDAKATSCPRRAAAKARLRVVYVGLCVLTLLTTKQMRMAPDDPRAEYKRQAVCFPGFSLELEVHGGNKDHHRARGHRRPRGSREGRH